MNVNAPSPQISFRYDHESHVMMSDAKNIVVEAKTCIENECNKSCNKTECQLCVTCLSSMDFLNLQRAHREHERRGGFKRIFPTKSSLHHVSKMTPRNQIQMKWFDAKCQEDESWCQILASCTDLFELYNDYCLIKFSFNYLFLILYFNS